MATKIERCGGALKDLVDGATYGQHELVPLRFGGRKRVKTEAVGKAVPLLWRRGETPGSLQKCRPNVADTSKITNLYAQVVNRLSPRNWSSLAHERRHLCIGRCLIDEIVELGTGDSIQARPSSGLRPSRPEQQGVQSHDGLVPFVRGTSQPADPSS